MKYPIIEHHYEVSGGLWTELHAGITSNKRKTIEALAERRRAGKDLPSTLAHWTVGDHLVAAQNLMELANRQEF